MKVLIIAADTLRSPPSGPAYVAGAARDAGHTVEVFERLFAQDLAGERGITADLCRLFRDSGCDYINLSIEAASDKMLKRMNRGYTTHHIKEALTCFSKTDISFGASLMIGAPGETPETIAETFELMDSFHIPQGIWVTIGICLWTHHQNLVDDARRDGQLENDKELFEGACYMSPELSKDYMIELIESLRTREDCTVQVNKPYAEYKT